MPARLREALESAERSMANRGSGSARDALRLAATLRGTYQSWRERRAAAPRAASLDHNDLHPWNMLVPRPGQPGMVRFDDAGSAGEAEIRSAQLPVRIEAGRGGGRVGLPAGRGGYTGTRKQTGRFGGD
jgi:Phosphotransferase enzyme family